MKYAAIAIDIGKHSDGIPFFIQDVLNDNLKVFSTELAAEKYLKKHYAPSVILLGTIPDPTEIYGKLNSQFIKNQT